MTATQIYIAISLVVLLIIAVLVLFVKQGNKGQTLTPLTGLAFGFVLAGILFSDDRGVGYSLMGGGVIIAVIDMIKKLKK